jgi:glycosyltransferase involved in cell wall biosynthesis
LVLKKDNRFNQFKNLSQQVVDFGWYTLDEQLKLPRLLSKLKPDLVHFPHFNVPVLYRGKYLVTIHDLIHKQFSMQRASTRSKPVFLLKRLSYNYVLQTAIKKSQKIITVSNYVKSQISNTFDINPDKIEVTYEGIPTDLAKYLKTKSQTRYKYIFYVGNAHPHKNVTGLIKAFLAIKPRHPDLKLYLAGQDHYFWSKIKKDYRDPGINYLGKVTDQKLGLLYRQAQCFVMPSKSEGFGLPMLEAFLAGCPVLSSNAASLPEIGGNGALYFDPYDQDDFITKLDQILTDSGLRRKLTNQAKKQITKFSFTKMAKQTLDIYKNL